MTTKTMKEKATELLQRCEVVTLASVNKEGYPRPVPMSKILAEGISTIWMSTGADSLKTIDFLSNPKAGLCFQDKGDSVALTGKMEVVTDEKMKEGEYSFYVNCYANRGGKTGFRAEIEFDGNIYSFNYDKPLHGRQNVAVAKVTLKDSKFSIKELLPSSTSTREIWGVNSNQFVPVSVAMYSPNYWNEQTGNGNRHYFFMLKDCVNPEKPNGFYNEFLKAELLQHKRVFEALGSQMAVQSVDDQLSGVGFSETQHNSFVVKVQGTTERVLKVVI